ncbi:hypothetical protein FQN57_001824 [Myotisia sp. PD_48]|nr:hypothetical protein FQN57_001824 [Myotisia sp. PD_48]
MESPTKKFPLHGTPLHPISPRRFNQQNMNVSSPNTSEPSSPNKADRLCSGVQSRVAFLNRLASPSPAPAATLPQTITTTAALQRAILGREEAEDALQITLNNLSEAKSRERRVSERLESLLEELHSMKERQLQERALFEKEIRKARKEAFRASSAIVKVQEELKSSRGEIKNLKDEVNAERDAREKATQEAFERAYALAGLTEELEVLKEQVKVNETDAQSEILEARADIMRGETPRSRLARSEIYPTSCSPGSRGVKRDQPDTIDRMSPVRKRNITEQSDLRTSLGAAVKLNLEHRLSSGNETAQQSDRHTKNLTRELEEDLQWERHLRRKAEDMVEFLKLECQFKRCSCRIAESQNVHYTHDLDWEKICQAVEREKLIKDKEIPTNSLPRREASLEKVDLQSPTTPLAAEKIEQEKEEHLADQTMMFCPDTGTFTAVPSPRKQQASNAPVSQEQELPLTIEDLSQTRGPPHHADLNSSDTISDVEREQDHQSHLRKPEPADEVFSTRSTSVGNTVSPITDVDMQDIVEENKSSHSQYKLQPPPQLAKMHSISSRSVSSNSSIQTVTTTTTIPLQFEKSSVPDPDSMILVPGTPISREEALAQIRARRGRTQSALKRSASANDANTTSTRVKAMSGAATPRGMVRAASRAEMSVLRHGTGRRGLSTSGNQKY